MAAPTKPASPWLVTTEWLASRLKSPDLVVVDGSFYLPAHKRDAAAEYKAGHIPGAVRFDIDEISDHSSQLPHMLPSAVRLRSRGRPARHLRAQHHRGL